MPGRYPHQAKKNSTTAEHHGNTRGPAGVQGFFQAGNSACTGPHSRTARNQDQEQLGIGKGRQCITGFPPLPGQDTGPGGQPLAQARRAEQNQRQPEYHHSVQVAQGCGQSLQQATQAQALGTQQDAMQKAKDHVLPGRAVPQAGEQKNDHQVTAGAGGAASGCHPAECTGNPGTSWTGKCATGASIPPRFGQGRIVEVLGSSRPKKVPIQWPYRCIPKNQK